MPRGPALRGGDKGPFPKINRLPPNFKNTFGVGDGQGGGRGPALRGGDKGPFSPRTPMPPKYDSYQSKIK